LLDSRPGLSSKWKYYIHCPRNAGHPTDYLQRWLIHYNYHRAHTAIGNQPPATLAPTTVTNVMMQNN